MARSNRWCRSSGGTRALDFPAFEANAARPRISRVSFATKVDQMSENNFAIAGRRNFFSTLGVGGLAFALAKTAQGSSVGPLTPAERRNRAFEVRLDQAVGNRDSTPLNDQLTNGDEETLVNKIGTYTKGLPHNAD